VDRARNYHIAWSEIGWDLAPVRSHFRELLGSDADALLERATAQAEHSLNAFDGVFCLADEGVSCDSHAHPPDISWRIERIVPDQGRGPAHRRLTGWRDAVCRAAFRSYQHLALLDGGDAAGHVPVPSLTERDWDVCLLPDNGEPILALAPGPGGTLTGLAVSVHERAYKRLLADLPADEAEQAEFLAIWGSVDGYLLRSIADGTFSAIQPLPVGPAQDRPRRAAGIELAELPDGLIVRQAEPPRVHQLNNTASVIVELCDGQRTLVEIAEVLASAFELEAPPLAEAADCVAELRHVGVLLDRAHYPAEIQLRPPES
jgi:coenzyme PQQ synthesis protein D (PqqD)